MVSDAVSINRTPRFDMPFIVVCLVAVAASVVAYMQYQRATQLTAALATANDQSAQLHQQIAHASSQIQQQSAQMQQQVSELRAEAKPDLPLSVGFRPAILGTGLVMELRNNSASELEIAAVFSSEATGQHQQRNLVLPPNRIVQLGSSEGWAFEPGQRITFSNTNYRAAGFVVSPAKQ
jgi:hypothetical protein